MKTEREIIYSQGERPQNETNLANILINLQNCEKMLFFFF